MELSPIPSQSSDVVCTPEEHRNTSNALTLVIIGLILEIGNFVPLIGFLFGVIGGVCIVIGCVLFIFSCTFKEATGLEVTKHMNSFLDSI